MYSYSIESQHLPQLICHHDLRVLLSTNLTYNMLCYLQRLTGHVFAPLYFYQLSFCLRERNYNNNALCLWDLIYLTANPHLIKDITNLERIQKSSTKYILNDYTSDHLQKLESFYMDISKYELHPLCVYPLDQL